MYKIIELIDDGETSYEYEDDDEFVFKMWWNICTNIENNYKSKCELFFNDELISTYSHDQIVPYPEGRNVLVQSVGTGRKGEKGTIKQVIPSSDGYPLQYIVEFTNILTRDENSRPKDIETVLEYLVHGDLWSNEER